MASSSDANPRSVKGTINVQPMVRGELASLKEDDRPGNRDHLKKWFDVVSDTKFEKREFLLELVSVETSDEKDKVVKAQENAKCIKLNDERTMFIYECNFEVPKDFGEIGAVLIQCVSDQKETYIKNIVLKFDDRKDVTFTCESWIHSKIPVDKTQKDATQDDKIDVNTTQKGATGDDTAEKGATGDDTAEKGATGDDTAEKGATGDDTAEKGATGDDTAEKGATGDDAAEKGATGDDAAEKGATGDDTAEKGATGDDTAEKGATGDDTAKKGATGDDTAQKGATGDDTTEKGATGDDTAQKDATQDDKIDSDTPQKGAMQDDTSKRIFFTNKSYLPSKTPAGLKSLREKDLESLRGNGKGQRTSFDRIYDYDTYNDLGDPDNSSDLARPVLGGTEDYPYPRRCRTGRIKTGDKEPRNTTCFYVPRDEEFSDTKAVAYGTSILYTMAQNLVPSLGKNKAHSEIESLFDKCVEIIGPEYGRLSVLRRLLKDFTTGMKTVQEMRSTRKEDDISFCWYRDEEFCRQTLAGINPYSIKLVTEWPLKSKLKPTTETDDKLAESAITEKIVNQVIGSFMAATKALEQKKLFVLDYHDMLLPYVNEVRELEKTPLYGSRTLMFLTSTGTLRPIAIELARPLIKEKDGKERENWKHVYTPHSDAELWKLAKAHVLTHDSGYHQLVSHWLRTHCVTEPYIIATHRHLSKMHPIHRLLSPHFRYTMQINALARLALINAGGYIELGFSLGRCCMQLSSDAYRQWRFDQEALPADLISRGMAVEDLSAPHGIKLAIEDYPFANDGLLLWDAIKHWATTYVNHYYPQPDLVVFDEELQAWWTEIKTKGHKDKKEGWPELKTQHDLIGIVSTIMWVTSGHHSAVNFGQYTAGYSPNRPTIVQEKMPNDPIDDLQSECLRGDLSTKVMDLLDILSSHSPDEEYIGKKMEPAWEADPVIRAAFQDFSGRLKELDDIIDSRNRDPNLRNRKGRGCVPYELFKPFSEPGVTGKGVPYSISI